jgi:vacuolar-type H+-ATPase subunit H
MEKDILSRVIESEKEIQEKIKKEKEKSLEWIEKAKKEARESMEEEVRRREATFRETVETAGADAEKKAVLMIEEETVQAEKILHMSDDMLKKFIKKHLIRIRSEG